MSQDEMSEFLEEMEHGEVSREEPNIPKKSNKGPAHSKSKKGKGK